MIRIALACVALFFVGCTQAEQEASSSQLESKLKAALPGIQLKNIERTDIPQVTRVVTATGEILYVLGNGDYLMVGDLYRVDKEKLVNVTEQARKEARVAQLETVKSSDMIVFPAQEKKAEITVFTDIDCFYCRKLHQEVSQLNKYGIQVNYLAYPRAGIGSESYKKAVSAWCADNPQDALTRAKNGETIEARQCENPVASQYNLGRKLGISGTPAIILQDGELVGGYVPADKLAGALGLL